MRVTCPFRNCPVGGIYEKEGAKPCVDVHSAQLIRFLFQGGEFYKGVECPFVP